MPRSLNWRSSSSIVDGRRRQFLEQSFLPTIHLFVRAEGLLGKLWQRRRAARGNDSRVLCPKTNLRVVVVSDFHRTANIVCVPAGTVNGFWSAQAGTGASQIFWRPLA